MCVYFKSFMQIQFDYQQFPIRYMHHFFAKKNCLNNFLVYIQMETKKKIEASV